MAATLTTIPAGMPLLYDGNKLAYVGEDLAARFRPGDRLLVVSGSGDVLHLPLAVCELVQREVDGACAAFQAMSLVEDTAVTRFYEEFAARLGSDEIWARITAANQPRRRGCPGARTLHDQARGKREDAPRDDRGPHGMARRAEWPRYDRRLRAP